MCDIMATTKMDEGHARIRSRQNLSQIKDHGMDHGMVPVYWLQYCVDLCCFCLTLACLLSLALCFAGAGQERSAGILHA